MYGKLFLPCLIYFLASSLHTTNHPLFAQAIAIRKPSKPATIKLSTTNKPEMDPVDQFFRDQTSSGHCDLPVLQGTIAGKLFRQKYWNKSPVIIRGMADEWPAIKKWKKEYLVEKFGEIQTQIGTSDGIIKAGGTGNQYVKFGDYVNAVWGEDAHLIGDQMPDFTAKVVEEKECENDQNCIANCEEIAIASKSICEAQVCSQRGQCVDRVTLHNETQRLLDLALERDRNDTVDRYRYGEIPYLFDRENFMTKAEKFGITNDLRTPSFFRGSEITSKAKHDRFKRTLSAEMQERMTPPSSSERRDSRTGSQQTKSPSQTYIFLTPRFDRLIGVGMHQHTDGWNAQLGGPGVKLWFIYPPTVQPGPEHPVTRPWCCGKDSWIRTILPNILNNSAHGPGNLKPLMCTQRTGDIIYIPEWWHHATLSGPGPEGKGGVVGVASQLGNPSGDLALNYQARTITQIDGDKEKAFQLMRKHIALNSASSYSSIQQMVQMITDEVRAMEQNGTDQTLISQMPLVVEAIELAEKLLKWAPDNVMMLSTIGNLVMLENQTKVAMDYLKRIFNKETEKKHLYITQFIRIIKATYGTDRPSSHAVASLKASLQHPQVIKDEFGLDTEDVVIGIYNLYEELLDIWTTRAVLHPYSKKVHKMVREVRLEIRRIRAEHPDAMEKIKIMREEMRQNQQREQQRRQGGGGQGGPPGEGGGEGGPRGRGPPGDEMGMREGGDRGAPGRGGRGPPPGQRGGRGPPQGRGAPGSRDPRGPPPGERRGAPPGRGRDPRGPPPNRGGRGDRRPPPGNREREFRVPMARRQDDRRRPDDGGRGPPERRPPGSNGMGGPPRDSDKLSRAADPEEMRRRMVDMDKVFEARLDQTSNVNDKELAAEKRIAKQISEKMDEHPESLATGFVGDDENDELDADDLDLLF